MWFTRLAISRPILIWMALAAIAVLGLQAYTRLPAELNPKVDIPTLTVTTVYAGAGPPEIESQITRPLEEVVGTVGGVQDVFSSSQANVSIISIDFQVGTNLDMALADTRSRIEAVRGQLPAEARPPVVAKLDINALPILYFGLECPSLNQQQLRALADSTIQPRLERVPGVATVRVLGGEQREIHVDADAMKLAEFGLTIEDVVNSIKASGRDVPSGGITYGGHETDIRLAAAFSSLEAIRTTQILAPPTGPAAGAAGQNNMVPNYETLPAPPITVADVARVTEGTAERAEVNRINGQEGISLVLTKASDANTVAVVNGVDQALAQLRPSLPAGLKRVTLRDDSGTVRDALRDVDASLILGAVLAMGVILFFLHNLRGTFIVSLAIPACIVATLLVMYIAHFTLNQMTLLALSLSVGILVDDSIVVLESITRHLRYGETPTEAAYNGRSEIGFADITTTLVDVVVFVPVAFMGGIVGGFFKQFGLTIAAATLFSLVISFSVTPMLASRWYRSGEDLEAKRGVFGPFERFYQKLESLYRRVIRWALQRRVLVLGVGVAALVAIFALSFARLGFEFLPGADQGQITVDIEMPPGASLAATDAVARRVEKVIATTPDVAASDTNVGQILGGFGSIPQEGAQFAQINVRLRPKAGLVTRILQPGNTSVRTRTDESIAQSLRHRLQKVARETGSSITASAVRSVAGISAPVEIQFRGQDMDRLTRYAEQVRARIQPLPGVLDPGVSVRSGKPEVRAQIDRRRAAQYGIAPSLAGAVLRDSVTGNTDAVFRRGGQEFPIRIRLKGVQRDNPADIRSIVVGTDAQGVPVTLRDIADITNRTGPTNIDRDNGQRLVTVTANLAPGYPLGNVRQRIQKVMDAMPHGSIGIHWGGEAETMDENAFYFANALILAVILVYIVLASLFNSLGTPLVIMFTLPMALIGALGALVITGETMSLVSAIGILMLVGLMGRNAILLLDYTNTLRARGAQRNDAIEEAGATRLRPILMTTTATIVGMLPVAMRIGRASEMRAPMAVVVIGGLIVSTGLTLVVIPVLYSLFDDGTTRWKRRKAQRGEQNVLVPAQAPPTAAEEPVAAAAGRRSNL